MVTALTINYNTPELLESLLTSFRRFYNIPYLVVDGSDPCNYKRIEGFKERFNVEIHHFHYNIHHGGGMAYGFQIIKSDKILLLDSDVRILKTGFLEDLLSKFRPDSYGIGDVSIVNRDGINVADGIKYLHPSCALINREIALKYPLPIKHGAPMIRAMEAINGLDILQHEAWLAEDLVHSFYKESELNRNYIVHEWRGTVNKTGWNL
jgi:cellulose synthase/poly-beta-1,6-N-acetylglucosamine synthase-like glycosyltransferase